MAWRRWMAVSGSQTESRERLMNSRPTPASAAGFRRHPVERSADDPAVVADREVVALDRGQECARRHGATLLVAHAHQQLVMRWLDRRERGDDLGVEEQPTFGKRALCPRQPVQLAVATRDQRGVLAIDEHAVASAVLRRVAGRVRGVQHLREAAEAAARAQRHQPDARAQAEAVDAPDELELVDGLQEALCDALRVLGRTVREQHAEFVATEARHHVVGTHALLQQLGELAQQLVAGDVTAAVVDGLEPVQVDEQHRALGTGDLAHLERALQADLELAAVGESRERIVARVVGQLLGQFVGRRDVGQRALVEQHAALGVAHGARVLEHDDLGAVPALQHQLRVANLAALGHRTGPVLAVIGIHVDVARNVHLEQLVLVS